MLLELEPQDTIQTFKIGHRRRHFPREPWEGMLGSFITYDPGSYHFPQAPWLSPYTCSIN